MARVERALIIGAGLAGLALARRLGALGCDVDVVERRPGTEAQGAGILLTGNALRALHALHPELERGVLAAGRRVSVVRFTDQHGRELFRIDSTAQPGWPAFVSIQREALQRVLLHAAPAVVPRFGVSVAGLSQRDDAVEVTFSDGTRASYALVVGADGVHSALRQALFAGGPAQPIEGFCGWRFLAPCPASLHHPQYMLGNGRTLLLHPLPGDEVYCGAGPVSEAGLEDHGDELARMQRAFADFGGAAREVLAGITAATALIPTRYWQVEQTPWSLGRCVLIGDAAHACAPTLAQGGAMAFEDALVLGGLLAGHGALDAALAAFEARRRPRVAHAQAQSLARMQANRPLDARALAVRNALLAKLGAAQLLGAWRPLMEGSA